MKVVAVLSSICSSDVSVCFYIACLLLFYYFFFLLKKRAMQLFFVCVCTSIQTSLYSHFFCLMHLQLSYMLACRIQKKNIMWKTFALPLFKYSNVCSVCVCQKWVSYIGNISMIVVVHY